MKDSEWDYYCYDRVASTMDQAKILLPEKQKKNLLVMSQAQHAARGRQGKTWLTTCGSLAATFVMPVPEKIDYSVFSLVIGMLLIDILDGSNRKLMIKWPNDLWTKDYKKVAGILVEQFKFSGTNFISIGIGINLEAKTIESSSASLYEAIGIAYHPCEIAGKIAINLPKFNLTFQEEGFQAFWSRWNELTFPVGTEIEALVNQKKVLGRYHGVDSQGKILLKIDNEEYSFTSLEISKVQYVSS